MTNPKIKPCPNCKNTEHVAVYKYESGGCHVECTKCNYLGPGEGSVKQAIKEHNRRETPAPDGGASAVSGGDSRSERTNASSQDG